MSQAWKEKDWWLVGALGPMGRYLGTTGKKMITTWLGMDSPVEDPRRALDAWLNPRQAQESTPSRRWPSEDEVKASHRLSGGN